MKDWPYRINSKADKITEMDFCLPSKMMSCFILKDLSKNKYELHPIHNKYKLKMIIGK